MKEYTLKFNFIIPVLRLASLIFSIAIVIIMIMVVKEKEWKMLLEEVGFALYSLFIIGLFSILIYQMIKGILKESLWIKVNENQIEIKNLVLQRKYILTKNDISSIFRSNKQFGRGTWETVVIFTKEGKSFELVQFNYFDFKKIIEVFINFGYRKPLNKITPTSFLGKQKQN